MKKILFLCILICGVLSVQAGTKLKGFFKVSDHRQYHIYLKALLPDNAKEKPFQQDLNPGSKRTFVMDVAITKAGLFSLSIVMQHADGNKSNYSSVIYLSPGNPLNLEYHAKDKYGLICIYEKIHNANNKALFEITEKYNQRIGFLYKNARDPDSLKAELKLFYTIADTVLQNRNLNAEVKKYLDFKAFDVYNANMYRFAADISRGKDKTPVTDEFYVQPKDVRSYFNDPMLLLFYNGISNVARYLEIATSAPLYKSNKSIAEINKQIDVLKKVVSNPVINDVVISRLLGGYISVYRVGSDFEGDLRAYANTTGQLTDPELRADAKKNFENLRYTMKGASLPAVKFENADGETISLDQFKGKYLFIDLWASWCVPCIKMTPFVQQLEKQYEGKNINFVAISIDGNKQSWLSKMKELNMHGHQLLDLPGAFGKSLNITGIPHYMIYDPEGKLVVYKAVMPDNPKLRETIDQLLAD